MKRASYRAAVAWIAANDEPDEMDYEVVAGFISTMLVADIFGKEPNVVADDVVFKRWRDGDPDVAKAVNAHKKKRKA